MSTEPPSSSAAASNVIQLCNTFFSQTPIAEWDHARFSVFCSTHNLDARPGIINNRYVKELQIIANDTTTSSARRRKAQRCLNKFSSSAPKRRKIKTVPSMKVQNSNSIILDTTFGYNITDKRSLASGDDSGERAAKRPRTTSCSTEDSTPGAADESVFVDHVAVFDEKRDGSPATALEQSPVFDPTKPTLRYQFACTERALVFDKPPSTNGTTAPIGIFDASNPPLNLTQAEENELTKGSYLPSFASGLCSAINHFLELDNTNSSYAQSIRELAFSSPYDTSTETYSPASHDEAYYVHQGAAAILSMIRSLASCHWLGHKSLQEGWYAVNVWGPLIDQCFHTLANCTLSRTEIKSRTVGENKRFDGIVAALAAGQVADFGAIEVARDPESIPVDKEIVDSEKLTVVLGCMLREFVGYG